MRKKYLVKDLGLCCSEYVAIYMIPPEVLLETKFIKKHSSLLYGKKVNDISQKYQKKWQMRF